jgi:hypothetical protein
VTSPDQRSVAERLGLPPEAVRNLPPHRLRECLDLDETEIRERLWRAHLAFVKHRRTSQRNRIAE